MIQINLSHSGWTYNLLVAGYFSQHFWFTLINHKKTVWLTQTIDCSLSCIFLYSCVALITYFEEEGMMGTVVLPTCPCWNLFEESSDWRFMLKRKIGLDVQTLTSVTKYVMFSLVLTILFIFFILSLRPKVLQTITISYTFLKEKMSCGYRYNH